MASITDKTVTSKYQPKSTNVIWVDTSLNPPVEKHFVNGKWKPMGGGVSDYSDIKNKPTINGVELDGNKTSQDLGVYSKPSSGIPQSDLSSDVQSQLNKHFKGWFASVGYLETEYHSPVVGDYAYVKGAESTDPAAIYECTTAGTWSDSGRTADTSNVQTFASGEAVNEVHIVDDLTTGGIDDVLSAEQGKHIGELLNYVPNSLNLIDNAILIRAIPSGDALVNYATAQAYYMKIKPGQRYTIDGKVNGNRWIYCLFTSQPANGVTFNSQVGVQSSTKAIFTAGNSDNYLYIYINVGTDVNISDLRVYEGVDFRGNTHTKLDLIKNEETTLIQKTLFDASKDDYLIGYMTSNGSVNSTDTNYVRSGYIPVLPEHNYRFYVDGFIAEFDDTKAVINGGGYNGGSAVLPIDFTTSQNCRYVVVSGKISGVAQGSIESVKFVDLEPNYNLLQNSIPLSPLIGKKIVCFGDSNTGLYRAGWPLILQEITGALTYNVGFPGCRMECVQGDSNVGTNPFSMAMLADAIVSNDWSDADDSPLKNSSIYAYKSLSTLKTIDFSEINCILIAYGTNEYGYPQDDDDNPENVYTYAGALRYAMHKLMTAYPQLTVITLTPIYRYSWGDSNTEDSDVHQHPVYGGKLTDNVSTLISVSNELKIPCIDMYHTMSVNKYNRDYYYIDGTHMNFNGFRRYASVIAQHLNCIKL